MTRPRLLDLFCGSGGGAVGYHRAGFDVFGVDNKPQPHYPFPFRCMDALEAIDTLLHGDGIEFTGRLDRLFLSQFDAIHASPPCQRWTALRATWNRREHPDLVAPTRERLESAGVPWVMENVVGAPFRQAIILCGSMFRLGCEGAELRRHRLFETSFPLMSPYTCQHGWSGRDNATVGVYGHAGGYSARQRYCVIGVYGRHGRDRRRPTNGQRFPTKARAEAMGIDWMTGEELSQAIPPAYTAHIGKQLMAYLRGWPSGGGDGPHATKHARGGSAATPGASQ